MAYQKIPVQPGDVISSNWGNHVQTQYDEAKADLAAHEVKIATETEYGHVRLQDIPRGGGGGKVARFVIGTSTAGWTENDVDYLCDGTNDQEEINAAIQAIPASGGEIIILDGTYNIHARIDVNKSNVSIKGNGNATVLKRMWNSNFNEGVITLSGASNCKIENLQIYGNKTSLVNHGIYLEYSDNNIIAGNTCDNNNDGISFFGSSNNTIIGNICNNNDDGIYLNSSDNNTITGNTCNDNDRYYGIDLVDSNNNTITGNTCNGNDIGINLYHNDNNTITGNTCNDNLTGIYMSANNYNNTITGNTCNNNLYGIHLVGASNSTIVGNTCIRGTGQPSDYTTDQYTIYLAGSSNYNLISSNNCMGKDVVIDGGTNNTSVNNKYN